MLWDIQKRGGGGVIPSAALQYTTLLHTNKMSKHADVTLYVNVDPVLQANLLCNFHDGTHRP
jgi:hypothetical protein